jgi:hypothetical protein
MGIRGPKPETEGLVLGTFLKKLVQALELLASHFFSVIGSRAERLSIRTDKVARLFQSLNVSGKTFRIITPEIASLF